MIENLSQREKILATVVGSLVPLALLTLGIVWFLGQRSTRNIQIAGLLSQIELEENRLKEAVNAGQRRLYYRGVSLPSNFKDSRNKYQQWLKELVRDNVGMSYGSTTSRTPAKLKFNGVVIGQTETFTLLATTNLEQLVDFLTQFYQLDLLHRINSITLDPRSAGSSGAKSSIRSGQLGLTAEIEVLSLVDADADLEGDFVTRFRELGLTADQYRDTILKRNIFGPANNTPTLAVSKSSSYTSGKDIRIALNAKDADANQALTFTVLESPNESAKIEQKKPTDRRVYLTAPGQPAGEYTFKVQVSDSGYPPKINETQFTIEFKDKVVKKSTPKPPKPPKPEFEHARETRITAIVKDKSGAWQVWIKVRTNGDKHRLAVGESFKLDKKEWRVVSIEPREATFEVDGKEKSFKRNMPFDGAEKTASIER